MPPLAAPQTPMRPGLRKPFLAEALYSSSNYKSPSESPHLLNFFRMTRATVWDFRSSFTRADGHDAYLFRRNSGSKTFQAVKEDRKSTRLNSSHLVISYAVFCLKKNKR